MSGTCARCGQSPAEPYDCPQCDRPQVSAGTLAWVAGILAGEDGAGPRVVRLADVTPERISWLWDGYLPLGKLVVLDGDPGVGKSTLALDLAARVSTGAPMPDSQDGSSPAGVLVLSAEDGLADTIRPRLDAAGADVNQVVTITEIVMHSEDEEPRPRPVSLPLDLPAIEKTVATHNVRLVIVDVLMAYLGADVNSHRDQDVRRALHQLAALADRTGACVLALRHLNKSGGANPLYRGGGSIGIVGAARAGFLAAPDPDDDSKRVFAPSKMNLAPEPPALAYTLKPDPLHGVARVHWIGKTVHRAGDLLAPRQEDKASPRDHAGDFLRDLLAGGPVPATEVKERVMQTSGISWATIRRAADTLGVERIKEGRPGEKGQRWIWRLPEGAHPTPEDARRCPTSESEHLQHLRDEGEHLHDADPQETLWPAGSRGEDQP